MTVTLHSFLPLYARMVDTAAHLLAKGKAFAAEKGISEQDMLNWKLAEDMLPLSFQFAVTINFARGWSARAAGVAVPDAVVGSEMSIAQIEAALAEASQFLATLTPDQINGREEEPITFKIGDIMEPTLPSGQWITGFATTNIYFHVSMVYAILRLNAVPLGKLDMFPKGL